MLRAILQSVAVIITVGLAYIGVKWALDRLNVNPQRVYELNRAQRRLAATKAEGEILDALIEKEHAKDRYDLAYEDISDAREERQKAAREAAKEAAKKAKRAA
jgi:hypothetical protein